VEERIGEKGGKKKKKKKKTFEERKKNAFLLSADDVAKKSCSGMKSKKCGKRNVQPKTLLPYYFSLLFSSLVFDLGLFLWFLMRGFL
jgi:hypothetical protein